jgi:hypothetical protein
VGSGNAILGVLYTTIQHRCSEKPKPRSRWGRYSNVDKVVDSWGSQAHCLASSSAFYSIRSHESRLPTDWNKPQVWPDLEAVDAISSAAAAAAEITSPCPASCALALSLAAAAISAADGAATSASSACCPVPSGCSCQLRTSTTGTGCTCWLITHCATLPRCCGSAPAWHQHWTAGHISPD